MDLEPDHIPNSKTASEQPNQFGSIRIRIHTTQTTIANKRCKYTLKIQYWIEQNLAYPWLLIRMRSVGLPDGIAVSPYIHLGKAADVPDAHHRHSEVPEKVNNLLRLVPSTKKTLQVQ
jgi:hypothetical protein